MISALERLLIAEFCGGRPGEKRHPDELEPEKGVRDRAIA
jgi:hypothetical protein